MGMRFSSDGVLPGCQHDAFSEKGDKISKGRERGFKPTQAFLPVAPGTNVTDSLDLKLTRLGKGS